MYGGLYPKSDVERLYIPKIDGGRGLIATEDCVKLAATGLEVHVYGSEERLLQAARGDSEDGLETLSILKKAKRLQDWEENALHDQYLRQTKEVKSEQS